MSSSRFEDFRRVWTTKTKLMTDEHWQELLYYLHEADEKKQQAREDAQIQIENLRRRDSTSTNFDDEARKTKQNLDTILELIEKESEEFIQGLRETQRKEKADLEKAYREALAARPFMNGTSPSYPAAVAVSTVDNKTALSSGNTALTPRIFARVSPGTPLHDQVSNQDTITAARKHDQPAMLAKHFSCTVQREFADGKAQLILRYKTENRKALQEIIELPANPSSPTNLSANPLPTPGIEQEAPRTVTFDEVYQNGQAKHKDTIVEYPSNSGLWYILKCEEHKLRFGPKPLHGAAKHLSSRFHGCLNRSWAVATEVLGYRVINCTRELAALNNKAANDAFAHGCNKPMSMFNLEREARQEQHLEIFGNESHGTGITAISRKRSKTSRASITSKSSPSPPRKRRTSDWKTLTENITNPKTFHIYYCFWKDHQCRYPVMILSWDDQTPGGLDHDLAWTGLLDKDSNPPSCYIYKVTESGKKKAIAGWVPGFEDGGSKVNQRKFPAMFFDSNQDVSWVSANLLSKFPLFETDPPQKRSHPFNVARCWVAKNEGFSSWEEFEEARKGKGREQRERLILTPSVSSLSDAQDADNDSDTGSSEHSYDSNITEKVTEKALEDLRDKAGEITGDSDYAGSEAESSEMDSSLDDEHKEWERAEVAGLPPWAWYGLRNKSHTDREKTDAEKTDSERTESSPSITGDSLMNNKAELSIQKGMETARRLSMHACTRDEDSAKKGTDAETSSLKDPSKGMIQNLTQDGNVQSSRSTPMIGVFATNIANQATPPPKEPVSRHITEADGDTRMEEDIRDSLRTPTRLSNRPSPPPGELGENSKGIKRVMSQEAVKPENDASREQSAKKSKQDVGAPDNLDSMSIDSEPQYSAPPPIVPIFKPKEPLGPAVFELSSYSKGLISWIRESESISLKLYYGEGDKMVGTVDAPVDIVIDPTTLGEIAREEIPQSKGNVVMTLFSKHPDDAAMKVVFDRPLGSKIDIGKLQSRKFLRWLRSIVPTLPLLEG